MPPQYPHVFQQFLRFAVGQGNDFLVHHRVGETAFNQQVAKVVHVDKRGCGRLQSGIVHGGAQFCHGTRPQAREHDERPGFEHAPPFGQHGVGLRVPVQRHVRPHHIKRFGFQCAAGKVGQDEPHRPRGAVAQAFPEPRLGLNAGAGGVEQGGAGVEPGLVQLRVAGTQGLQGVARAAAGIQNVYRLMPDVAEALQHALGDFAVQELGGIERAAPGKLAGDVARTDTQGRGL